MKTYWRAGWHWPPAGKSEISGIQNVETLIFWILDLIWIIFVKFLRNWSFTGSVGLIIDSSRSGTCFSSCLRSSTYFSRKKKTYVFYRVTVFLCSDTHRFHSFKSISEPCSIEKYPFSRMANRYTRIFDAGWKRSEKDIRWHRLLYFLTNLE